MNADTITGGAGNDVLAGSTGADTIDGGDGTDTYAMTAAQIAANIEGAGTGTSVGLAVNLGATAVTGAAVLAATGKNLTAGGSLASNTVAYTYTGELSTNSAVVDTLTSIENVTLATAGVHYVMGSAGKNTIVLGVAATLLPSTILTQEQAQISCQLLRTVMQLVRFLTIWLELKQFQLLKLLTQQ